MGNDSRIKHSVAPRRLEHFSVAINEFIDELKINSRLAQFEGDDRIVADALIYLQKISTLDS